MEYQVTARKWRPQNFQEIIGQDSIVTTIRNALSSGKIPHAFLFSGVRGVGKTTTARVIAKALNCPSARNWEPCNECPSCREITNGYSMDVIEIDGASNRGIDNIRQVRDTVTYMPMGGRYKIYIIDEVHMLTNEASNALLKTLEEPPDHVVFILATTEPHKVLPTIKSRCQHFVFRKIPARTIMEQLSAICDKEKISRTEEAIYLIASAADGSMRDAQSIFDQVVLYTDGKVTEDVVEKLIGVPDMAYYSRLIESVQNRDALQMLRTVDEYAAAVGDLKLFTRGFIQYLKNGLLVKKLPVNDPLLDLTEAKYSQIQKRFEGFTEEEILRIISIFVDMFRELKGDANERFSLEVALFKMLDFRNLAPLSELRGEILELVKKNESVNAPVPGDVPNQPRTPVKNSGVGTAPTPSARPEKDVTSQAVREALVQIMSSSMLMSPLVSSIRDVTLNNNTVRVEISDINSCEFLSNNRSDFQQEMARILNRYFQFQFLPSAQAPAAPEKAVQAPPKAAAPSEATAHGAAVRESTGGQQPEKLVASDNKTDLIKNLFEGREIN